MDCSLETVSPVIRRIVAEGSADEVNAALEDALRELGAEHEEPGYRKGHVPPELLKTRLKDQIAAKAGGKLADRGGLPGPYPNGDSFLWAVLLLRAERRPRTDRFISL